MTKNACRLLTASIWGLSALTPCLAQTVSGPLAQVPNNTALQGWATYTSPVVREGYSTPGDGGIATYEHTSSACSISGGDGGSQVPAADGGCWNIDWASVNRIARPQIFGATFNGQTTSQPDTNAVQAAANTGMPLGLDRAGSAGRVWAPSNCISLTTTGQEVFGSERYATAPTELMIQLYSGFGTTGTTAPSCPGLFNYTGGEPGPHIHDLGAFAAQPNSSDPNANFNYPAFVSAIGQPRGKVERVGCFGFSVCFDVRGNSGGWTWEDVQVTAVKTGIDATGNANAFNTGMDAKSGIGFRVDGALDTMRWHNVHIFPVAVRDQTALSFNYQDTRQVIGFQIGRCDGCYIDQLMNINGLAFFIANGVYDTINLQGASFGAISNTDFDGHNAIFQDAGEWKLTNSNCNLGVAGQNVYCVLMSNGTLVAANNHLVKVVPDAAALIEVDGGVLQLTNNSFDTVDNDVFSIYLPGGSTTALGNTFHRTGSNGKSYANPQVYVPGASGVLTFQGNREIEFPGNATGYFILSADGRNAINYNVSNTWMVQIPGSGGSGIYGPNVLN